MTWSARLLLGTAVLMAMVALVACEGGMTEEQIESAREKALSDLDKPLEKMKIKVSAYSDLRCLRLAGVWKGKCDDWATCRSCWACFPNAACLAKTAREQKSPTSLRRLHTPGACSFFCSPCSLFSSANKYTQYTTFCSHCSLSLRQQIHAARLCCTCSRVHR